MLNYKKENIELICRFALQQAKEGRETRKAIFKLGSIDKDYNELKIADNRNGFAIGVAFVLNRIGYKSEKLDELNKFLSK